MTPTAQQLSFFNYAYKQHAVLRIIYFHTCVGRKACVIKPFTFQAYAWKCALFVKVANFLHLDVTAIGISFLGHGYFPLHQSPLTLWLYQTLPSLSQRFISH